MMGRPCAFRLKDAATATITESQTSYHTRRAMRGVGVDGDEGYHSLWSIFVLLTL